MGGALSVFLCRPAGRIVARFVSDGPFGEEECSDAVVRQVHRQNGRVVGGAECPGAPEDGEIDQCFCDNVRPAVKFGGAVVRAVRAPFRVCG